MRNIYTLLLLSMAVVAISADLQSDFSDIIDQLPKERISLITQEYAAVDSRFRSGPLDRFNLQHFLGELIEIEDVKNVLEYFKDRGIDIETIMFRFIPELFGYPSIHRNSQKRNYTPEISGDFAADVLRTIPASKISVLIHEKLQTSPEFAKLAEAVQDPKFKTLLYRAMNSKAVYGHLGGGSDDLNVRGFWSNLFRAIVAFFRAW